MTLTEWQQGQENAEGHLFQWSTQKEWSVVPADQKWELPSFQADFHPFCELIYQKIIFIFMCDMANVLQPAFRKTLIQYVHFY